MPVDEIQAVHLNSIQETLSIQRKLAANVEPRELRLVIARELPELRGGLPEAASMNDLVCRVALST